MINGQYSVGSKWGEGVEYLTRGKGRYEGNKLWKMMEHLLFLFFQILKATPPAHSVGQGN